MNMVVDQARSIFTEVVIGPTNGMLTTGQREALIANAERTMETVHELAARWHRADERRRSLPLSQDLFNSGLMAGYVQAVSMLTGVGYGDVERQFVERRI